MIFASAATPACGEVRPANRYHSIAVAAIIISLAFVIHACWLLPNHDSTTYIVEAQKLLTGGRFYFDIVETNPPLIVFLTVPGVLISEATSLDPWTGFVLWVCLLVLLSWLVALPYLRWAFPDKPAALLSAIYLLTIAIRPSYDFSQREHLTAVLFLPGLLWFAAREAGRPSPPDIRCLIALLLGAVGLLIKPFFLVVLAVLVLVRAASHRDWRMLFGIETLVVVLVGLLYTALMFAFFRDWFSVALLATQVYFGFELPWPAAFWAFGLSLFFLAVTILVFQITPMAHQRRVFLRQVILGAAVFLAIAILQRKGWQYHALPTDELILITLAFLGIQFFDLLSGPGKSNQALLASFLALLFLADLSAVTMLNNSNLGRGLLKSQFMASQFAQSVNEMAAGRPWFALDTSVAPAFPTTLLVGAQWSSRNMHQWMIPGIVKLSAGNSEDRTRAQHLQQIATHFVTEDLERYRPVLVAVKVGHHLAMETPFDFLQFFAQDEDFRRAWRPYHLAKSMEGWEFYVRS